MLETPFDARAYDTSEIRVLQAALAASGDYAGGLDGRWTEAGAAALADWSAREFGAAPLDGYAGAAVSGFLDAAASDGWREVWVDDLGLAVALPTDRLGASTAEADGARRWTRDGSFAILTHRFDEAAALAWHDTAAGLAVGDVEETRGPDRRVTTGTLADGRAFFTRSDLIAGAWSTVYLAAEPSAVGALRLSAASVHAGRPEAFAVPAGGRLAAVLAETERLMQAGDADTAPAALTATPASFDTEITALPPRHGDLRDGGGSEGGGLDGGGLEGGVPEAGGTGTGFYVGPHLILTAEHVVVGCDRPALADGTPLERLADDAVRDIAALAAPRPARRWLALAEGLRLGQRVHALGFPYYSIAGTSLTLTGGNVSALAGIDDDRDFFTFSAPVQPGNSGGPLIDARGRVVGLVVARLSEDYIVEATGSLPQNVNYALRGDEVADFLAAHGLAAHGLADRGTAGTGAFGRFDPDDGVPDGVDTAIVPIVCS